MKNFFPTKEVKVSLNFVEETMPVGRLALHKRKIYFEYDTKFIESGIELSPINLPLQPGVQHFDSTLFEGLPGVFNDSLPDGWGRLIFDRFMRSHNVMPKDITPLDRLTNVGSNALGALVFEPDHCQNDMQNTISLDKLSRQTQEVLVGASDDVLAELIALNGSSAGARPKALIGVNDNKGNIIHGVNDLPEGFAPWIVKFPNTQDGPDAGAIEYVYALMAKEAGISMPDVHLFSAQKGAGYFATKRFDRDGTNRYHMHTACGLLHSDFRTPMLDYEDLMALTCKLTRDIREMKKMFQLAVFNVLAYNRDDHSKNFSFLMDLKELWKLSPAYDITYSSGPGGEQSTMVMGEGLNPNLEHLLKLAEVTKINITQAQEIIKSTRASLAKWPMLAKQYGVSGVNIKLIKKKLNV